MSNIRACPCPLGVKIIKVINDVVGAYGTGSTIVFCETKAECNDVIESKDITFDRRALHGDIPQACARRR